MTKRETGRDMHLKRDDIFMQNFRVTSHIRTETVDEFSIERYVLRDLKKVQGVMFLVNGEIVHKSITSLDNNMEEFMTFMFKNELNLFPLLVLNESKTW